MYSRVLGQQGDQLGVAKPVRRRTSCLLGDRAVLARVVLHTHQRSDQPAMPLRGSVRVMLSRDLVGQIQQTAYVLDHHRRNLVQLREVPEPLIM
jgi:hypothetical protein